MIDIKKKLNRQNNFYIYNTLADVDTIEVFIKDLLAYGTDFYYKNVYYIVDYWTEINESPWAVQINADRDKSTGVPYRVVKFEPTESGVIKLLETFRLHDGVLWYDAMTKPGKWKDFIYKE